MDKANVNRADLDSHLSHHDTQPCQSLISQRSDVHPEKALIPEVLDLLKTPFRDWTRQYLLNPIPQRTQDLLEDFFTAARSHSKEEIGEVLERLTQFLRAADKHIGCDWQGLSSLALATSHSKLPRRVLLGNALSHLDVFRYTFVRFIYYHKPSKLGNPCIAEQCRKMLKLSQVQYRDRPYAAGKTAMLHHQAEPELYCFYGACLAFTGSDYLKAKTMLLNGIEKECDDPYCFFVGKRHLAHVMAKLGETETSEKVETELIRYIRTRPLLFSPETIMRHFRVYTESPNSLVEKYERISGRLRNLTPRDLAKSTEWCAHCGKSGGGAKLLRCGKCDFAAYCDKLCQQRDRKRHEERCEEEKRPPNESACSIDFRRWTRALGAVVSTIVASALDLYTDFTRADHYTLVITCCWHPELDGFERFSIVDAQVLPNSVVEERTCLCAIKRMREQAEEQDGEDPETRKYASVSYGIDNDEKVGGGFIARVAKASLKQAADLDWKARLKMRVPAVEYTY